MSQEAPQEAHEEQNQRTNKPVKGHVLWTRCSPSRLHGIVKRLSEEQREAVKSIGFGGLLHLRSTKLKRTLCAMLMISKFDPLTRSITIGDTPFPFLEKDVDVFLGIRCNGDDVRKVSDKKGLTNRLRAKYQVKTFAYNIDITLLEKRLEKREAKSKKHCGSSFLRDFVLYALAVFLCPPTNLFADGRYLLPLLDMDHVREQNWGKHIHDFLISNMIAAKTQTKKSVAGCLFLLEMWFYEHTKVPGYTQQLQLIYPRLKLWGDDEIRLRDEMENEVGVSSPCCAIWEQTAQKTQPEGSCYEENGERTPILLSSQITRTPGSKGTPGNVQEVEKEDRELLELLASVERLVALQVKNDEEFKKRGRVAQQQKNDEEFRKLKEEVEILKRGSGAKPGGWMKPESFP